MNEKLLNLIKEYEEREQNLLKRIIELSIESEANKKELEAARLARVLWRQVIQDLSKIIR